MPNKMISLFDYLGYAADSDLGKQVAEYGKIRKTAFDRRQINNKKYKNLLLEEMKNNKNKLIKLL